MNLLLTLGSSSYSRCLVAVCSEEIAAVGFDLEQVSNPGQVQRQNLDLVLGVEYLHIQLKDRNGLGGLLVE